MSVQPTPRVDLAPSSHELTFVSWNVRGCAGRRDFDPHASAAVLLSCGADVAALQECGSDEHGREHAEAIARSLGFAHVAFGANVVRGKWRYGNALVSRHPLADTANVALPGVSGAEARGCVLARVRLGNGATILTGSAHLGLGASERTRQAMRLVDETRLAAGEPLLLGADGNDWFPGADTRALRRRFRDAWKTHGIGRRATYPSRFPVLRLDHVYVGGDIVVLRCEHSDGAHVRSASDHLPVIANVRVAYSEPCSSDRSSQPGSLPPAC